MKKRELQSRNGGGKDRKGVKGGNSRDGRRKRSISAGSLEEHVDPAQMYDYFKEQSVGISKKAEGDRAQLNKVLDINKQMRQYDLKRIKQQEMEDMDVNLTKLKDNWAELRTFIQAKVQVIGDVKDRHEDDVKEYRLFCEYLEPSSLREKLEGAIKKLDRETDRLRMPVSELAKKRDYMIAKRDRAQRELEEQETKNKILRDKVDLPEDLKSSASAKVQTMRGQMREMKEEMLKLEKATIDIGRNPGKAIERISNPLLDKLQE